ncbi:MAG: hydroxyethylthiazole kinase [Spirochaetaceae bacterium]|jgi:hydroxyethylthiazole kinase|nr:hydroxyethylthiazole kinase [Spirochaetaceae bacterium]
MIIEESARIIDEVRNQRPLVHCITNYITTNDCANILLSFGASPAMCDAWDEAYDFARISASLYINFGTYIKEQEAAAVEAALGAKAAGRPVVVDPVGCAAIRRRIGILDHLHEAAGINLIKGNMGEIMALAGKDAEVKGVDSDGAIPGIEEAVQLLAAKYRCVVAATGRVDVVGDGKRLARISNGAEMLTRITGAGCMTGALCGAAAAVAGRDGGAMFAAACAAIAVMGIAGELAFEQARLPGSFRVALIDRVYGITGDTLRQRGNITC